MLVVFAPGTAIRKSMFEDRGVLVTVIATAKRFIRLLLSKDYMLNPRFVIYMILLIVIASMMKDKLRLKSLNIHPIVLFLTFSMFQCGMLAVPYYAMGTFGAGRIKNIIWMAFMVFTGLFVIYSICWLCQKNDTIDTYINRIRDYDKKTIVVLASIALVLFSRNMYSVVQELSDGTAVKFAQQYNERYELMKKYRDTDEIVYVEELIDSHNLKFGDLTTDVDHWINEMWSKYYHVKTALKQ